MNALPLSLHFLQIDFVISIREKVADHVCVCVIAKRVCEN